MAGTELGKAYVQIVPSAKGIKGGIKNALDPEAQEAGSSAGNTIVGTIKNMLIAAGIGKALKDSISAALSEGAALQQSLGGIETLFGTSADTMKRYAAEAYKECGLSANQYMEQATSFAASLIASTGGDTAQAAEVANRALKDMSDNANKMGTDMESIQNAYQGFAKQNYTMLDNLKLGYGGTQEEMARLIHNASAMTEQQEKLNIKVNDGDMSFANIANAISVVQEKLGIAGSTAEEAKTTFSGSFRAMSAAAKDLMGNIAIGADIGPSIQALAETASTFVFNNLLPMLGNIAASIPEALGSLVSSGIEAIGNAVQEHAGDYEQWFSGFMDWAKQLIPTIANFIFDGAPVLTDALQDLITGAVNGLAQLAPDKAALDQLFASVFEFFEELVPSAVRCIVNNIPEFLSAFGQIGSFAIESIGSYRGQLLSSFGGILSDCATYIVEHAPEMVDAFFNMLGQLVTSIGEAIPDMLEGFGEMMDQLILAVQEIDWAQVGHDLMTAIIDGITGLIENVGEVAGQIWEKMKEIDWFAKGGELMSLLRDGIGSMIGSMLDVCGQAASNMVTKIKETDWIQVGRDILQFIIDGLTALFTNLTTTASDLASKISTKIKETDWVKLGRELISNIIEGIKNLFTDVGTAAKDIANKIKTSIEETNWWKLGQDIIQGMINGIGAMGSALWEAAKNIGQQFLDDIKSFFGIKSPSRVMRDEVGKFIPPGIALGIEAHAGDMTKAMEEAARKTVKVGTDLVSSVSLTGGLDQTQIEVSTRADTDAAITTSIDKAAARLEHAFNLVQALTGVTIENTFSLSGRTLSTELVPLIDEGLAARARRR